MPVSWPSVDYREWQETCDTLHAHTQVLGKLAVALAPPEPAAAARRPAPDRARLGDPPAARPRRLRARSWSRSICARTRQSSNTPDGRIGASPLTPDRPVGDVTRELLAGRRGARPGPVEINPTPQEVPWTVPLDEDTEHARYDTEAVERYFAAATQAALVLAAFRAPYRGRSTPVNAWWGSFDLAVNLFSGAPADPPSGDFIMRNAMDAQEVAVGWWPGDGRYPNGPPSTPTHIRRRSGFAEATLTPDSARWDSALGEYVLDWDDVR